MWSFRKEIHKLSKCPTGLPPSEILLGEGGKYESSCVDFYEAPSSYFIPSGETFPTTNLLYTDSMGTILAPSGWYSDGEIARYWNGSSFTNSTQECMVRPISLGYDTTLSTTACDNFARDPNTYYIPIPDNFYTATEITTTVSGTILAPPGFYSNGIDWREWNGTAFINDGSC